MLQTLLIFLLITPSLGTIFSRKEVFFNHAYWQRYEAYKNAYYSSQYVKEEAPSIIPDEIFNSFAGGFFLLGNNPIHIVHDHPPLGRYLISLSILIFKNEHIHIIFWQFLTLLSLYLISKSLIKGKIIALIPLFIFAFEPLYLNQFKYTPLLEPIQLPFIFLSLYFTHKSISSKREINFFLTSIFIGLVITIRFFPLGMLLYFTWLFSVFIFDKREIKKILIFSPAILIILLTAYFKCFLEGYSLRKVLGIQKYMYEYHKSQLMTPFSAFDLLLFNRWHTWWGERLIASDPQWRIWWPTSFFLAILSIARIIKENFSIGRLKRYFSRKENSLESVLIAWIIIYLTFLSVGQTTTRYFFPILPIFYILAVNSLNKLFKLNTKS